MSRTLQHPGGLSVITATLGRPEAMLDKLASLAAQTLPRERFEWLVAFDGAQPELEERLRLACPPDLQLRTVTTSGVGPGPARDAAAALAAFEVLYLSDDDCLPAPATLARHFGAQQRSAVYLGEVTFEADGRTDRMTPPRRPGWWHLAGANTSLPRVAFEAVGGFGTALHGYGGEDLWLGWRLKRAGWHPARLSGAPVRHLGPQPQRSGDSSKARQAGANAVRIARLEPRLAWRLGVHPWMLTAKRAWLNAAWTSRLPWSDPQRRSYEQAYAFGASDALDPRKDGS